MVAIEIFSDHKGDDLRDSKGEGRSFISRNPYHDKNLRIQCRPAGWLSLCFQRSLRIPSQIPRSILLTGTELNLLAIFFKKRNIFLQWWKMHSLQKYLLTQLHCLHLLSGCHHILRADREAGPSLPCVMFDWVASPVGLLWGSKKKHSGREREFRSHNR